MAKITSVGFDDLLQQLQEVADQAQPIAEKALYNGAGHMAGKIRKTVDNMQTVEDRDKVTGKILDYEKEALQDGLTIEKFKKSDRTGSITTAVKFHGRSKHRTKSYPDGVPTQLLARAITKGTTFRKSNRFFSRAVNSNRKETEEIMKKTMEDELKKIIK